MKNKKIMVFLIVIIVAVVSIAGLMIYKYNTSDLVSIIENDYSRESGLVPQVMATYVCVKKNGTVYSGYNSYDVEKVKRLNSQKLSELKEKLKNFEEHIEGNNSQEAINRITINGITYGGTKEINSKIYEIVNFLN